MGGVLMKPDGFTPLIDRYWCRSIPDKVIHFAQHLIDCIAVVPEVRESTWTKATVYDHGFIDNCYVSFRILYPCFPRPFERPEFIRAMPNRDADIAIMPFKQAVDFSVQIEHVRQWLGTDRFPIRMEISSLNDDYTIWISLTNKKN
jgi:hypothetical protein